MIWKLSKRLKYERILVSGERNLGGFLIGLLHKAENKKNYVAHGTMLFKISFFAGRLPSPAHDSDYILFTVFQLLPLVITFRDQDLDILFMICILFLFLCD
ncbi:hypothetical protein QL285_088562 [Trifolium repens]|jgi:hypothetical protein|nr:hypothetical protein QL285_088562 [Trifolium repens]